MRLATRRTLLSPRGGLLWWIRDYFTTDEASPLTSPRTAEPGPGTWTVDNARPLIHGGMLVFPPHDTISASYLNSPTYAHKAGRCAIYRCKQTGARVDPQWTCTGVTFALMSNGTVTGIGVYYGNTYNNSPGTLAVIRSEQGYAYCVDLTTDELIWYYQDRQSVDDGYFRLGSPLSSYNGIFQHGCVVDLGAPWNTEYGIVTQRLAGSRSSSDTFVHEANALIDFVATTIPTAGQIEVRFRVQDSNNYYQVTVDSSGVLDLDEVVSGTPTQRGTWTGPVVSGNRIVVVAVGASIKIVVGTQLRISYASAGPFQSETDGEIETLGTGGAVSDLITWPRDLTGQALSEIEQYFDDGLPFLAQDEYAIDYTAGNISAYSTPGPAIRGLNDSGSSMSIVSGALCASGHVGPTDPGIRYAFADYAGLSIIARLEVPAPSGASWQIGWKDGWGFCSTNGMIWNYGGNISAYNGAQVNILDGMDDGSAFWIANVNTPGKRFAIAKDQDTGLWTLGWARGITGTGTAQAMAGSVSSTPVSVASFIQSFRVVELGAPFDTSYGIATDTALGAVAESTEFVHEADGIVEFTVTTVPSADVIQVRVRAQDSLNYWMVDIDSSGNLGLREVIAGSPTLRGSSAAAVTNGTKVTATLIGTTIRVYTGDLALKITYASATNFSTETDGKLQTLGTGGAVSDLATWPRYLSGAAAAELERWCA